MEAAVFAVSAVIAISGAAGVIASRNAVHSALSLIATLFAIAVLFIAQDAQFLAAVQVIVYAGAIVVVFLFVIMLLGVDRSEDLEEEPLRGQRPAALVAGIVIGAGLIAVVATGTITGAHGAGAAVRADMPNVEQLGRLLFTDYVFPFEVTSVLLVIAVVGAVLMARSRRVDQVDEDEPVLDLHAEDRADAVEEPA
ncbi:MAG: NADH-quinone oxidoreductase subunit J [Actinobacteria bacterium]|nr:NADH-quinone oxidoreductase subunit J [Actinomycetota bacterium]